MNSTRAGRAHRGPLRTARAAGAVTCAGLVLLFAAGCSASGSGSSASSGGQRSSSGSASGSAAGRPAVAAPRAAGFGPATSRGSGTARGQLTVAGPSLIYTARLTLRSRDVTGAAARAAAVAARDGGYVSAEHAVAGRGRRHPAQVAITLKIPVPRYRAALGQLGRLGRQLSLDQHVTDVTQQVADVASRVTSQQAAIAQLRVLLRRAGSVGALLGVQDQINSDESVLESLLAQQRSLSHQVSDATVTLTLLSPHQAAPRRHRNAGGFLAGLSGGWRAFLAAVRWVLTAVGAALPFAVLAAVLAGLGWVFRARLRRLRRRPPPAPADAAKTA
jgi:hypothetical protein